MIRSLSILMIFAITACQPGPPAPHYAMPRYDDLPPIPVQAADMQIVRNYIPTGQPPQMEHEFPVRLDDATEQWLKDRVKPVGPAGTLTFTIEDARVTKIELPRTKGVKGVFTKDQAERYDARLLVRGRLEQQGEFFREANVVSEVKLSRTLDENAGWRDREELFYDMTLEMVNRFGQTMEQQLRDQLSPRDSVDSWK